MAKIIGVFLGVLAVGGAFVGGYAAAGTAGSDQRLVETVGRLDRELVENRRIADEAVRSAQEATGRAARAEQRSRSLEIRAESIVGGLRVAQGILSEADGLGGGIQGAVRRVIENQQRIKGIIDAILGGE